jgi:hypothetical protein
VYIDGEDPGFDIADIKPFTESGFKKFMNQTRRLWDGGPKAKTPKSYNAAFVGYDNAGNVIIVGGKVGGGRP